MRLPFADDAVVPEEKLTGYLLSRSHPEGRAKAMFFIGLGFVPDQAEALRTALLEVGRSADMAEMTSAYGRKYAGVGILNTPSGKQVPVMTVWILRRNVSPPIRVTAYPA